MAYQKFNKRTGAWQKYQSDRETGRDRIVNVKEKEPRKPFKGVKRKR